LERGLCDSGDQEDSRRADKGGSRTRFLITLCLIRTPVKWLLIRLVSKVSKALRF
jgi:hypothetical protein